MYHITTINQLSNSGGMNDFASLLGIGAFTTSNAGQLCLVLIGIVVIASTLTFQFLVYRRYKCTKFKLEEVQQQFNDLRCFVVDRMSDVEEEDYQLKDTNQSDYCLDDETTFDELVSSAILTDDDWLKFQESFNRLYPGVMDRLINKYENLTQSELRYLLLSYLNLSHKKMAALLGISSDSLRVTWYRLRKKIDVQSTITVTEFWEEFQTNEDQSSHLLQ